MPEEDDAVQTPPDQDQEVTQTDNGTKAGVLSSLLKETRGQFLAAIAAVLVAAIVVQFTGAVSWLGLRLVELRNRIVEPVVLSTIDAQISANDSMLSIAVREAIEDRVNSHAGSVFAGSFSLSRGSARYTIPFFLPEGHEVELSVHVEGLINNEVLKITSPNPVRGSRTIESDGSFDIVGIRQFTEDDRGDLAGPQNYMSVSQVRGRSRFFFPVHMDLSISEQSLSNRSEPEFIELQSEVRVEFVGLLSPPIQRMGEK